MTCRLDALCWSAADPAAVADFWSGLLGWRLAHDPHDPHGVSVVSDDDTGFLLRFLPDPRPKLRQNHMHLDLTSASSSDQRRTVDRAINLGAAHADVGQSPDEPHVVLADPEGNEFCVIEPGNSFLADCGVVGAVACDGSRAAGVFWSAALGRPLVWDQGEETAIRSPRGGPKISWGGPPFTASTGDERVRFELAPELGGTVDDEAARLVGLGATRIEGARADGPLMLADPDGRAFGLGSARAG